MKHSETTTASNASNDANSGFFGSEDGLTAISTAFTQIQILGQSAFNVFASGDRYGRRWFIKGVRPDAPSPTAARQRLMKEFDIQVALVHPAIARVVGFEDVPGLGQCIVTEWIEGPTLEQLMADGSLSSSDRRRLLDEIIDAVGYLHSKGIVHRDLKPANIMVRKNGGSAVIIDFGLTDTDSHLFQKAPAGTEGYASERQHHENTPSTADDLHALGVITRQLCPGLSKIGLRSTRGRYPTAEALRRAVDRRDSRRKLLLRASVFAFILAIIAGLVYYNFALRDRTSALQRDLTDVNDSLTSLRTTSAATNVSLHDSLDRVRAQLDREATHRLAIQKRQAQIQALKNRLARQLESAYTRFSRTEDPTNPDNQSFNRLVTLLGDTKRQFVANQKEVPDLTDAEAYELEYYLSRLYSEYLQKWTEILQQHRPKPSVD